MISKIVKKMAFNNVKQSVHTATNIINYFVRRGQKTSIETKMRKIFIQRVIMNTNKEKPNKIVDRFNSFFIHATPFIALKTRRIRRGKRVINKIKTLSRTQGQRKSLIGFSSLVRVSGRSKKSIRNRVEHELDALYSAANKGTGFSQAGNSTLFEKRELLYKTAYSARNFFARKKVKKLTKNIKDNEKLNKVKVIKL